MNAKLKSISCLHTYNRHSYLVRNRQIHQYHCKGDLVPNCKVQFPPIEYFQPTLCSRSLCISNIIEFAINNSLILYFLNHKLNLEHYSGSSVSHSTGPPAKHLWADFEWRFGAAVWSVFNTPSLWPAVQWVDNSLSLLGKPGM